jgi:hypothetical protein
MKFSRWILGGIVAISLLAGNLPAQPFYLRGSFNSWDTSAPMTDLGGGVYSATISGTPGARFNFKVATADWSASWPGSDSRSLFDAAGSATVYYRAGAFADGWNPAADRVGYADPQQFGWEVIGSFNGWSAPFGSLTAMGGGLYAGNLLVTSAGTYDFKFREAGSWDIAIGSDFGNSSGNATVTTTDANQLVAFQLDLPNGRWSATVVPEPAALAFVGIGFSALISRIRRR